MLLLVFVGHSLNGWVFLKKTHAAELKDQLRFKREISIPVASKYYDEIITWMMYWPISAALYLLSDPIQKFYAWLVTVLTGVFNKIIGSVYAEEIKIRDEKKALAEQVEAERKKL